MIRHTVAGRLDGRGRRTFWEQAIFARFRILTQEPAIAKVVVALYELNAVSAPEAELVGTAGDKLVCGVVLVPLTTGQDARGAGDLRTTTRVSPGRQPSVWERCAMLTAAQQRCRLRRRGVWAGVQCSADVRAEGRAGGDSGSSGGIQRRQSPVSRGAS
jgi:hypothetical protein